MQTMEALRAVQLPSCLGGDHGRPDTRESHPECPRHAAALPVRAHGQAGSSLAGRPQEVTMHLCDPVWLRTTAGSEEDRSSFV